MKKVSFKVAKAIKEAGYPQDFPEIIGISLEEKNSEDVECYFYKDYTYDISLLKLANIKYLACPTYLEVWLWLWREKNIRFDVEDLWDAELSYPERGCASVTNQLCGICTPECSDPEEAIIAAIEYLVDNKLLINN